MVRYIGFDVHRSVVQVCILDEQGTVLLGHRFDLTRQSLAHFIREQLLPSDKVVLEATCNTWEIVDQLTPAVAEVVVSNPMQTKAIAKAKIKTDKVDARVLAQLLRCDFLPRVWHPDENTRQLRQLTSRRAGLVCQQTAVKNRIHSVLAQRLIPVPVSDLFGPTGLNWLKKLELGEQDRLLVDSDLRLLESIQAEAAMFDNILSRMGYSEDRVKLLMTLPGCNVTVALGVLAALGDPSRFPTPDQASSYLGLVPSTHQSGNKCYHGPITKEGNSHSRWLLIQAAQHVARHPGPLGVFFRRLKRKKNHNVALVAVARKLVTILWHMLKNNEPYRYAVPRSTEEKLRRLRVEATGEKKKTGPAKGSPRGQAQPEGMRRRKVKALAEVYAEEGLPATKPLAEGERKMLAEMGTDQFAADLEQSHEVLRPKGKKKTKTISEDEKEKARVEGKQAEPALP